MNKFFLLVFILFSALIIYQGILGKNGILEKYSIEKEKGKLQLIINLLEHEAGENDKYINELKTNPHALKSLANELGFFNEEKKLLKIIEEYDDGKSKNKSFSKTDRNLLISKINEVNEDDEKMTKIRNWIKIGFYIVFAFFIFLIIFGIRKNEE